MHIRVWSGPSQNDAGLKTDTGHQAGSVLASLLGEVFRTHALLATLREYALEGVITRHLKMESSVD